MYLVGYMLLQGSFKFTMYDVDWYKRWFEFWSNQTRTTSPSSDPLYAGSSWTGVLPPLLPPGVAAKKDPINFSF